MKTSNVGIDLIKQFEGLKLQSYLCPAKIWTIGYGTTRINGKPVKPGMTCTQEEAEEYLSTDLVPFEATVNSNVKSKLTQNQFDALVCFVYNVGPNNFLGSTLLKKLNANDMFGAADEFLKWNKANGKVLAGLTTRRTNERTLFLTK